MEITSVASSYIEAHKMSDRKCPERGLHAAGHPWSPMRTRPKKSARVRVRARPRRQLLEETGLVTHTPRGAHLELVVGRVGQPRGGGRRGAWHRTPDSRAVGQMRLDDSDERGPRGLSGFEADPAVELRGAQRDVVDVGDYDGGASSAFIATLSP